MQHHKAIITALMVILTVCAINVQCAVFPPSRSAAPNFSSSRLYDASKYLALNEIEGRAGCLVDVNKDKFTDMVVIGCGSKCIKFYIWSHSTWSFKLYEDSTIYIEQSPENVTLIEDISSADFNYDGVADLIVTTIVESKDESFTYNFRQVLIYLASSTLKYTDAPVVLHSHDQLAIIDANGDMRVDLFGESENGTRTFWINQSPKTKEDALFSTVIQTSDSGSLLPLAYPATTVFIDIDGDCSSDLFVISCKDEGYSNTFETECKQQLYEIWLNRDGALKLYTAIDAPLGAGRPVFSDYDRDGDFDLIVPVCFPSATCAEKNELLVMINTQNLRSVSNLCSRQDFNLDKTFTMKFPKNKRLANRMLTNSGKYFPGTLRAGDFNLDGFTDLVLPVLEYSEETKVFSLKIDLWKNVACDKSDPDSDCVTRSFAVQESGVDDLPDFIVTDPATVPVYNAFFMDLDESGVLDIMTTMQNPFAKNESIQGYYNNYFNDAYFLKTISLNGAKEQGTLAPGMTFKFTVSDLDGVKHRRISTQITQTTYSGLQTPYHLFGLGRTNGYIEEFFFGKPREDSSQHYQSYTGIIPNAQLVGIPYPPNSPKKWQLELYLSPSSHTLWVALAVFTTLFLLGAPIVGLWRWEKYQDNRAKNKSKMQVPSTTSSLLVG